MKVEFVEITPLFEVTYPVVIVGAGACGMCAALAVSDEGLDALVLEQDKSPMGATALSTGLIPAAATPEQRAAGIEDSAQIFADDIQRAAQNSADATMIKQLTEQSAGTVAWLRDNHQVPLTLVSGALDPDHRVDRMYGTPDRSGAQLIAALHSAVQANGVDIMTEALVEDLIVGPQRQILGVRTARPGGVSQNIGCKALILACGDFVGNAAMIKKYIPEMAHATFYGHPGNMGYAVQWGKVLGAGLADMNTYQGHGGLTQDHDIAVHWSLIMEGGFQVNSNGLRFSNESEGASEQAAYVLRQPGRFAWSIFDERLYQLMLTYKDFKKAIDAHTIIQADTIELLAQRIQVPPEALSKTLVQANDCARGEAQDWFQRDFTQSMSLQAPFYAMRVTGALLHTEGGLMIDNDARVLATNGERFPNLFACGGAARGISGTGASGYITGNGLLAATGLGKIAGHNAALCLNV